MQLFLALIVVIVSLMGAPLHAQFNITTNTTNVPQTTAAGVNQVQPGVTLTLNGAAGTSATVTIGGSHTFLNNGTTSSSRDADASGEIQDVVLVSGANAILQNNGTLTHAGNAVNGAGARTINAIRVTAAGLQLTNAGTISVTGTNNNKTMQTIVVGGASMTLVNQAGASITSANASAPVIVLNAGSGGFSLINDGTLEAFGASRALDTANSDLGTITLHNGATGIIRSASEDALRVRGNTTVNLTNDGQIIALNPGLTVGGGQALDFASAEGGILINNATGLIRADGHDAVRLGSNQSLTNYGTILGNSLINDSAANNVFNLAPYNITTNVVSTSEGVSFENASGSSLDNHGVISGSRHGVESDVSAANITITNRASGQIIGRNGSGIGFDADNASAANVVVHNYGLIRGDYAGVGNVIDRTGTASFTHDGDGDGIDVDGAVTINNYATGQILSTGAGGFDSDGRANNSEAIAIGGGIVYNEGLIRGASRGILVNRDTNIDRSAVAATTITNQAGATIQGLNGFAIRMEGAFNDSIVNYGTIIGTGAIPKPGDIVLRQDGLFDPNSVGTLDGVTYTGTGLARFIRGDGSAIQMGEGDDILDNYGTIIGSNGRAVNLEGGDDTMIVRAGSRITGLVNGGAHTAGDTLELHINGLTPEKKALLEAGMTVTVGGITFTNFEFVSGASTSVSYASLSQSPTTAGVASALDNIGPGAGASTLAILDAVDTSTDPERILLQLTPKSLEGIAKILTDSAAFTGAQIGARMDQARQGGPQFDVAGVRIWDGKFDLGLQRVERLLADVGSVRSQTKSDLPQAVLPVDGPPAAERWGIFLHGNAVVGSQGATADLPESDYVTAAVTGGIDYRFTENLTAGIYAGYGYTDADLDALGSSSEIDSISTGLYGSWSWNSWFIDGVAGYAHGFIESDRRVLGASNTGSTDSNSALVQGRIGRDFRSQGWTLTPMVGFTYTYVALDSFTESGPAALRLEDDEVHSFRSQLGGRINHRWRTPWGAWVPEVRAFWVHEYLNDRRDIRASFVDTALPGTFTTPTANLDRDFGMFGVGMTAEIGNQWTVHLQYDVEAGREEFVAHQINGGVRFQF